MREGFPAWYPFQPARALYALSLTLFLREAAHTSHAMGLGKSYRAISVLLAFNMVSGMLS